MNTLAYTSIHQMTNLLLETAQMKIEKQLIFNSLQGFLFDLNQNLKTEESTIVAAAIEEFVDDSGFDVEETEKLLLKLITLSKIILNDDVPDLCDFFTTTFKNGL